MVPRRTYPPTSSCNPPSYWRMDSVSQFPNLSGDAANGTAAHLWDTSGIQPNAQNFQIRIQRQLAKNLILTAQYNRQYGRNEFVNGNLANPNAIRLENLRYRDQLNNLAFANSLRPYPQFQDFDVAQSFALETYQPRFQCPD